MLARLSKSKPACAEENRWRGGSSSFFWVLLNTGNATDGTLQPDEANLGYTKGLPTWLLYALFSRAQKDRIGAVCGVGECRLLGDAYVSRKERGVRSQRQGAYGKALMALFSGVTAGRQL